jgi:hypothetical protein
VIHPQRLTDDFRKHRSGAGIPTGSLHVLRHTCATLALSKGIDLMTVAWRLGDDEVTVLRTYSHLVPSADERAADVLAAVLVDNPLTNPAILDRSGSQSRHRDRPPTTEESASVSGERP